MAMIDDDAGKDRNHGEDAGCERKQQTKTEKAHQYQRQVVTLEQAGDARAFIGRGGGALFRESRRWRDGAWRDPRCRGPAGCGQIQLRFLVDRRIADATVPAALRHRLQRNRPGGFDRQQDLHVLAVRLDPAEILVFLHLARRQLRRTQRAALQHELELVAVHVVTVGDLPARLDGFGVDRTGRETERFFGWQRFFGAGSARQRQQQQKEKADQHRVWSPSGCSARVSALASARVSVTSHAR
jgi:hypothetical protein